MTREERWSRSIAVGSEEYIENIKGQIGEKALYGKIYENEGCFDLRESQVPYTFDFDAENGSLRQQNTYVWNGF